MGPSRELKGVCIGKDSRLLGVSVVGTFDIPTQGKRRAGTELERLGRARDRGMVLYSCHRGKAPPIAADSARL